VTAARLRGGVVASEDLNSYAPKWEQPIRYAFGDNLEVVAPDFPSAGPALLHALGILNRKGR
jgi:gamma-glutamyltranspeptidase